MGQAEDSDWILISTNHKLLLPLLKTISKLLTSKVVSILKAENNYYIFIAVTLMNILYLQKINISNLFLSFSEKNYLLQMLTLYF